MLLFCIWRASSESMLIAKYSIFRYLVLDIADNPVENRIRCFPMTEEFIDGSLQSGGKTLVPGHAGIHRSAAFVIACIMETFGVKYRDAFVNVQERRFCINPHVWFVHHLQEYEAIHLAKLTIRMMSPLQIETSFPVHSGTTGSLKRTPEEDDDFGNMQVATAQNGWCKQNINSIFKAKEIVTIMNIYIHLF